MSAPAVVADLRRALEGRRDVRVAVLFGSHARGTAHEGSDVDLAVLSAGADLFALAASVAQAIDREVDVIDLRDPGVPMLLELIEDGIVVHESAPGEGALWRSRTLATLETDRPWFNRMRDAWLKRVAREGL